MLIFRYLLAAIIVLAGIYFIGREQGFFSKNLPEPRVTQQPVPTEKTPACDPIQYAVTRVFSSKTYKDLAPCLANSVRYSRFESSDSRNLNPEQLVQEISNLSREANSWITNPDDPAIKQLKIAHEVAWYDAVIVLADNKIGFAFNLDREGKIMTAVFISNYPAISSTP